MRIGPAKFYDGRSPVATAVDLEIDTEKHELLIKPQNESSVDASVAAAITAIPLARLKLEAPLGQGNWALRLPERAVLECPSEAYDPLTEFLRPSIGARLSRKAERSLRIALAAFVLSLLSIFLFFQFGIPVIAGKAAEKVPPEIEAAITREALRVLDRMWFEPSELGPARKEELRDGFAELAVRLSDPPDYRILFRRSKIGPNAFALPAGTIVMTDELVEFLDSDEQIYGVLAHELGHIDHNHGMRAALQASGHALFVTFFMGDVTATLSVAAALPSVLFETGHSRKFEREADTYATQFALKTGFGPEHLIHALEKLTERYGDSTGLTLLSTHPPTAERAELIRSVARDAAP